VAYYGFSPARVSFEQRDLALSLENRAPATESKERDRDPPPLSTPALRFPAATSDREGRNGIVRQELVGGGGMGGWGGMVGVIADLPFGRNILLRDEQQVLHLLVPVCV
jgi:hypothetical protein